MIRYIIAGMLCVLYSELAFSQSESSGFNDSTNGKQLEEVVIISPRLPSDGVTKPLSSLDNFLAKANAVNMIRRGTYAWEPYINGMASERSVITIDGMRIYAACTDKMDPVTSYVEITNLARANVHSGPSGPSGGATIAGSLDLVRKKSFFGEKNLKGSVFSGFESNNLQKIAGTALSFSQPKFFADIDFTWRNAKNYKAGNGNEILYSGFTKYNMSVITGFKINEHEHIETSVIYDQAVDVGYPALPMDVSLARAVIASVEYIRHHISPTIAQWKTKFYYNDVKHVMDDSKRPIVPIRMDMPGWSKTIGFYSIVQGDIGKHNWKANLSGHHNSSLAEMTMHSNTPGEMDMFMLTWPGVHTNYADIFAEDKYALSKHWNSTFSAGIGVHNNVVSNQLGLESLKIFYAGMDKNKTRLLKRAAASLQYENKHWNYSIGIAYGERAPSVSEGFGFYLFNSFDRYDYIGNPEMKNEKSATLNGTISYSGSGFSAKLSGSYFYISDYIIGKPDSSLSVMTIGAAGVKVYRQLNYASIYNSSIDLNYRVSENWLWSGKLSYRRGIGADVGDLPLMQPLSYSTGLLYSLHRFTADLSVDGSARQTKYNPEFGESNLPDYVVMNIAASYRFNIKQHTLLLKTGVENVLDKNYTSFADWNRLPRMGRNIFVNLVWSF